MCSIMRDKKDDKANDLNYNEHWKEQNNCIESCKRMQKSKRFSEQ